VVGMIGKRRRGYRSIANGLEYLRTSDGAADPFGNQHDLQVRPAISGETQAPGAWIRVKPPGFWKHHRQQSQHVPGHHPLKHESVRS
jgi:hypothetical protein